MDQRLHRICVAVFVMQLMACAQWKDKADPIPAKEQTSPAQTLAPYSSVKERLSIQFFCRVAVNPQFASSSCPSVKYPMLSAQINLLEEALIENAKRQEELKSQQTEPREMRLLRQEHKSLTILIKDKKPKSARLNDAVLKLQPRLNAVDAQLEKAHRELSATGCVWQDHDLSCPSQMETSFDALVTMKREANALISLQQLHRTRNELLRSLPEPGAQAADDVRSDFRRSRGSLDQWNLNFSERARRVWRQQKEEIARIWEPKRVEFDDESIDNLLPSLMIRTAPTQADLDRVQDALAKLTRFANLAREQSAKVKTRAVDRILITRDLTSSTKTSGYEHHPDSSSALVARVALGISPKGLRTWVDNMGALDTDRWKRREARLKAVLAAFNAFPVSLDGPHYSATLMIASRLSVDEFLSTYPISTLEKSVRETLPELRKTLSELNESPTENKKHIQLILSESTTQSECLSATDQPSVVIYQAANFSLKSLKSCARR